MTDTRWKMPAIQWPGWLRRRWAEFKSAPGRLLWPVGVGVGLIAALYFGLTTLWGGSGQYAASDGSDGWLLGALRTGARIILLVAMAAAATWLLKWLRAEGLAPRLMTGLKLALALTPLSVWILAEFDLVYQPMEEPLRSYLLLIACPFVAAGLLVALDRRRAVGLAAIAVLALAGLFLGAGLMGRGLLEPVEHLHNALLARAPDQRMWWLALAALPVAIFALVSSVGDRPDEHA